MASTLHTTACPLDCPDACRIEATVTDGRVTRLEGADSAITGGFLCKKVRNFDQHLYHPDRVGTPLRRIGAKGEGKFEALSWDAALDLVVREFTDRATRYGAECILPLSYGGSNGLLSQDTADARLFARLGASRLARTVCAAPSGRAAGGLYGKMPGVAYEDYEAAKWIGVWGANPSASGIHLVPWIRRARDQGARLVVVDPRRTPLAAQADQHLALRPGTDVVLALATMRWLFEHGTADLAFLQEHTTGWEELRLRADRWTLSAATEVTGLTVDEIERFAGDYAAATPAVIRCGWGLERNRNGGSGVASVIALPAVAGKFGVRGGGYTMSNSGAWRFAPEGTLGLDTPGGSQPRTVNMNQTGQALLEADPPIQALFVYNSNPLATLPNQAAMRKGLAREDLFTVVFDQVMTDTAQYADVVLPATTFLEHRDLARGYGNFVLHRIEPVIEPVGESRSNVDVFGELVSRFGLGRDGEPESDEALEAVVLAAAQGEADLSERLDTEIETHPVGGGRPILFVDSFPRTADRKAHLVPGDLDTEADGLYRFRPAPTEDPSFPLTLISPASGRTVSSTFGQIYRDAVPLEMHPDDALGRGLVDGITVRVYNRAGEVHCPLRVSDRVRRGVVTLPKGLWSHNTINGNTSNVLCPDHLADLGGGASFNDARVEVEALRAS
ncbi:MAG: molybdopterin-dependent oxidoreductase [Thermoanaerobaculia bacterium]|nr:molybdopterin-dependent oxidoreductase [Thermoanaerobaculia bacterium]